MIQRSSSRRPWNSNPSDSNWKDLETGVKPVAEALAAGGFGGVAFVFDGDEQWKEILDGAKAGGAELIIGR